MVFWDTIWALRCVECRVVMVLLWEREIIVDDKFDGICSLWFDFYLVQDPCGVWLKRKTLAGACPVG